RELRASNEQKTRPKRPNPISVRKMEKHRNELEQEISRCETEITSLELELGNFKSAEESIRVAALIDERRTRLKEMTESWEQLVGHGRHPGIAPSVCFMSTVERARMICTKKLSAREALAAHLKQIERVNPEVNAIVTLVAEMAADAAAKADEMQAHKETLGPL